MESKEISKSARGVGLAIALSRGLGLVRDIIVAAVFGRSISAQAFVVAFRIPNLLRDLVAEGAANASFVPVLCEEEKKSEQNFKDTAFALGNILFVALIILTILGMIFSPLLVGLCAPGFLLEPQKYSLTVKLTLILFPYILLVGVYAFFMSVLNVKHLFLTSALGPCLMNIGMIAGALSSYFLLQGSIFGLAAGVLVGGVFQILIQIPQIKKSIFSWKFFFAPSMPSVKKAFRLLLPRIFGSAVYLANTFVDTIFASLTFLVGQAGVIAIYYSGRLFQLPLAIFGVSISSVSLPILSASAIDSDKEKFVQVISHSLRVIISVLLPSSAFFIALGYPVIKVFFQRGAFDTYAVNITNDALIFYSIGLFSYGCVKVLVNGFYAMQDTKTPVQISFICLILNIILNIILVRFLRISGIALATSISSFVNFSLLGIILRKKIGRIDGKRISITFAKSLVLSVIFGFSIFFLYIFFKSIFGDITGLLFSVLTGIILFLSLGWLLKINEIWEVVPILKKR
ncbi:murein biosynthesis integral membrane protein MurJ [bacterium Unc6]|nr:murein biosynthesis integral membrane protein MurJ [bacterium Unc6]